MYYLGIKCNDDPYDLSYLDFYFETFKQLCDFAEKVIHNSNYEIVISRCGDEDE